MPISICKPRTAGIRRATELFPLFCGSHDCAPGHSWGPAIREHYIIHLILSGRGSLSQGKRSWNLTKNQAFLICPDVLASYRADDLEPWSYAWVAFNGLMATEYLALAGLSVNSPAADIPHAAGAVAIIRDMEERSGPGEGNWARRQGLLYLFLAELMNVASVEANNPAAGRTEETYVDWAVSFMEANYAKDLHIAGMAEDLGLDRSYFCRIFKRNTGLSPMAYLISLRMRRADALLQGSPLSISEVARSVGYQDALVFSKAFSKVHGLCPTAYREKQRQTALSRGCFV